MNPYGYLELQMLTISSLKKSNISSEEGDTPEADPESWYTLIGKVKLENLIGSYMPKDIRNFISMNPDRFIFRTGTHRKSKTALTIFHPAITGMF